MMMQRVGKLFGPFNVQRFQSSTRTITGNTSTGSRVPGKGRGRIVKELPSGIGHAAAFPKQKGRDRPYLSQDLNPVARKEAAYFTGNPEYYSTLTHVNRLLRTSQVSRRENRLISNPSWMSQEEFMKYKHMKLNRKQYYELTRNLTELVARGKHDEYLAQFLKPGSAQAVATPKRSAIDKYGRTYTQGSRKSARAQCYMLPGEGKIYVNASPLAEYFTTIESRERTLLPLNLTRTYGIYNIWCVVSGGGKKGQSEALSVAIARGLAKHQPACKELLKNENFDLTKIDRRQNERTKTGQPGARKKNRWVKR